MTNNPNKPHLHHPLLLNRVSLYDGVHLTDKSQQIPLSMSDPNAQLAPKLMLSLVKGQNRESHHLFLTPQTLDRHCRGHAVDRTSSSPQRPFSNTIKFYTTTTTPPSLLQPYLPPQIRPLRPPQPSLHIPPHHLANPLPLLPLLLLPLLPPLRLLSNPKITRSTTAIIRRFRAPTFFSRWRRCAVA